MRGAVTRANPPSAGDVRYSVRDDVGNVVRTVGDDEHAARAIITAMEPNTKIIGWSRV